MGVVGGGVVTRVAGAVVSGVVCSILIFFICMGGGLGFFHFGNVVLALNTGFFLDVFGVDFSLGEALDFFHVDCLQQHVTGASSPSLPWSSTTL